MKINLPKIIQGGMGFSISDWNLAQTVSSLGQLGVVSGTALDAVLTRRLQNGDKGGHVRRALEHFPFPCMAKRILETYFVPGGLSEKEQYLPVPMHKLNGERKPKELCMVGNFVEVFLAREGHNNPVGINYLEKIQLPHLPSIYGAMLAGVSVVIMGAGIPLAIPGILDKLANHEATTYPISVITHEKGIEIQDDPFNPLDFAEENAKLAPLLRPNFLPIVSSESLASILLKRATGSIDGFIIESNVAGGHNAPPRGAVTYSETNEPIYGQRDVANLSKFRNLGLPFWLAGAQATAKCLQKALDEGAKGIQIGTAFALCNESGILPEIRRELIQKSIAGEAHIFTDPLASPSGFPFKVADFSDSLHDEQLFKQRKRVCDIGFLRYPCRLPDGKIIYRCPAEPINSFVSKGGSKEDTIGRKCLCNGLAANIGMAQKLADGSSERCLITMGNDLLDISRFCSAKNHDYSAKEVIDSILNA